MVLSRADKVLAVVLMAAESSQLFQSKTQLLQSKI